MHVYSMTGYHEHSYCMQHCQKLGGRTPSVKSLHEWETFSEEIQQFQGDPIRLPVKLWLSATEGDEDMKLSRLDHWPEGIEAEETVWRDFYTGDRVGKCHGYDGYIRVKKLASWGKKFGRPK